MYESFSAEKIDELNSQCRYQQFKVPEQLTGLTRGSGRAENSNQIMSPVHKDAVTRSNSLYFKCQSGYIIPTSLMSFNTSFTFILF